MYRLCFTTLRLDTSEDKKENPEPAAPIESKLTFELNVLKAEKTTTDKLGQVLSLVDASVSRIQGQYRNVRV